MRKLITLRLKIKLYFLNKYESKIKYEHKPKSSDNILIQMPHDYFFIFLNKKIIVKENKNVFSISPIKPYLRWNILNYILRLINNYFLNKKWFKIYKNIGVKSSLNIFNFKGFNIFKSIFLFKNIKTKKDLLKLHYKGLLIGDLVYDSYLRFNTSQTVNLKDLKLIFYINRAICVYENILEIYYKFHFKKYFSSYSTYIDHGIPTRLLASLGVKVFCFADFYFKQITSESFEQFSDHSKYFDEFNKMPNSLELSQLGLRQFSKRFNGINDLSYMKKSAYSPDSLFKISNLDGVVFLHDFFDSPHIFKSMLFEDFYEWALFTLKTLVVSNVKIGVKPHPNQIKESSKVVDKLKIQFPSIIWLDHNISNTSIFNSGIKFGISVYGTILAELAYNKITPIACGDNPTISYNFTKLLKDKGEYRDVLINGFVLDFDSSFIYQIGSYYYMHYLADKDEYNLKIELKGFNRFEITSEKLLGII